MRKLARLKTADQENGRGMKLLLAGQPICRDKWAPFDFICECLASFLRDRAPQLIGELVHRLKIF